MAKIKCTFSTVLTGKSPLFSWFSLKGILMMCIAGFLLISGCGNLESSSGTTYPQVTVIRSETEWLLFWNNFNTNYSPIPAVPQVDFNTNVVIFADDGNRPSGGYSLVITKVQPTNTGVAVSITEVSPGPNCTSAQVMTRPYNYVITQVFTGEVTQLVSRTEQSCN